MLFPHDPPVLLGILAPQDDFGIVLDAPSNHPVAQDDLEDTCPNHLVLRRQPD